MMKQNYDDFNLRQLINRIWLRFTEFTEKNKFGWDGPC